MIKDQENYPIALKFYNLLWYILFDVLYKFLRDCIIFRRFMLFLVCTFWFVKIKRKKTVTVTSILIYFKEIYRKHALIGPSQSLKITTQKVAPFRLYQLQDQIIYNIAMKQYLLSVWTVYMASKTKKVRKNAKMRYFFNSGWLKGT